MSHECQYCNKLYSTKSSLNVHIKTSKSCLREREILISYDCKYCKQTFTTNNNLKLHLSKCKDYLVDIKFNEYKILLEQKDLHIKELKEQLEKTQTKYEKLLITNQKNINNSNNTSNNHSNNQNYTLNIQSINLSKDSLEEFMEKNLTPEAIQGGQEGIAKLFLKKFFQTEDGQFLASCNDKTRQIIHYKSENKMVKDVKGEKIISAITGPVCKASEKMKNELFPENEEIEFTEEEENFLEQSIFTRSDYYKKFFQLDIDEDFEEYLKEVVAKHLNLKLNKTKENLVFKDQTRTFEFFKKIESIKDKFITQEISLSNDIDFKPFLEEADKEFEDFVNLINLKKEKLDQLNDPDMKEKKVEDEKRFNLGLKDVHNLPFEPARFRNHLCNNLPCKT